LANPAAGDTRLHIDPVDYKALDKTTNAKRALSVFVTREASDAAGATVSAVVELYDTRSGGMVGRGTGTFTATVSADEAAAAEPAADATTAAAPNTANAAARAAAEDVPIENGTARTTATSAELAQVRALGGAIYRAVGDLNRPAETRGVVISIPEGVSRPHLDGRAQRIAQRRPTGIPCQRTAGRLRNRDQRGSG
jgi:hypothetical protein